MNRKHKNKDKDEYKDIDKDKDTKRITESLTMCFIFGILMAQAFQEVSNSSHPKKFALEFI